MFHAIPSYFSHPWRGRLVAVLLLSIGGMAVARADETTALPPALAWPEAAREATCAAIGNDGKLCVGTLRKGLFVVDPTGDVPTWHRIRHRDGLGQDEITAIHIDTQGRVWVGHRSEGVSVLAADRWHHYPAGKGPAGERVWDIAECPVDGDVWIAHDLGLSRYAHDDGTWKHVTRSNGFPTWHVRCVAFDSEGTLIVGTQTEGLLVAKREGTDYPKFDSIKGAVDLTLRPRGTGLPSALVNDVLVDQSGRWIIATDRGLAISEDHGATFTFHRGKEWAAKLDGLAKPQFPAQDAHAHEAWLPDDYVMTLAEDADGRVWIGFMRGGVMALEPGTIQVAYHSLPGLTPEKAAELLDAAALATTRGYAFCREASCVRAIMPRPGKATLAISFPHGGFPLEDAPTGPDAPDDPVGPSPQAPPEDNRDAKDGLRDEMTWARAELDRMPVWEPAVIGLPDDWQTQGDWIGRYGRQLGVLCAGQSPHSIRVGDMNPRVRYDPMLGPHTKYFVQERDPKRHVSRYVYPDSMRYWAWDHFTPDRRALQLPPGYVKDWIGKEMPEFEKIRDKPAWHRRPAGIVDNAQGYPLMFDGPHLQIALDVPEGVFQVSLYLLNYDGNHGANRVRDYRLRVYHHTAKHLADIGDTEKLPLLHEARGVDFYSGVYKRLLVRGPVQLAIEVNRNHSFNTMLSGIFVDAWQGPNGPTTPPTDASLDYQIKK